MKRARWRLLAAAATVLAITVPGVAQGATAVGPYVESVSPKWQVKPLFSVNDSVPRMSAPATETYRMVGIPDGMGAHSIDGGAMIYLNHEFGNTVQSTPIVGGPTIRGGFVSVFQTDADGDPVKGDLGYDEVFDVDTYVGPIAQVGNDTPAFGRLCSATLAGEEVGFDRQIFMTNEESDAPLTFSPLGGSTVAVFDGEAHVLPALGHFSKETDVVWPNDGRRTVVFSLEDGPSTPDSQLYMFVGKKADSGSVLARNGLESGSLYTFVSTNPGVTDEASFSAGSITGRWVEVPDAASLSDTELEAASDELGAFGFVRIEDGAFAKGSRNDFYFVTTGGNAAAGNELGRGYHLMLNQGNVLGPARLKVVYNADTIVASGGDAPLSPDNVDASYDRLVIQEDGTSQTRAVMASKGRDGSIWSYDLVRDGMRTAVDTASLTRLAELNPPGRDGIAIKPGVWESSGVTDTADIFGADTWLINVQAHAPTAAPAPGTVEDGQLLLLSPVS